MKCRRGIVVALCAALIASGAAACGEGTPATEGADDRAAGPIPGLTDRGIRVGAVVSIEQSSSLQFNPPVNGLRASDVTSVLAKGDPLGGRTITEVAISEVSPADDIPGTTPEEACEVQRLSAVVILAVAEPGLASCITDGGSIVIDMTGTLIDRQGLEEQAPFLWASATAEADLAERVLWEQVRQRGITIDQALTASGPESVSTRVKNQVTLPALTSQGATVEQIDVASGASEAPSNALEVVATAAQQVADADAPVIRPLSPRLYPVMGSSNADWRDSQVFVTTANAPWSVVAGAGSGATLASQSAGLGWSPADDGLSRVNPERPADADAVERCPEPLRAEGAVASNERRLKWRLCDALQLIGLGLPDTSVGTAAGFRDAVWSGGQAWEPVAVSADGWTNGSYAGANLARWLRWDATCAADDEPLSEGCFAYEGSEVPLLPIGASGPASAP